MLYYSFVEFFMIYSLYFVFHYLFGGRLKKKKRLDIVFTNQKIFWAKLKILIKFLGIN